MILWGSSPYHNVHEMFECFTDNGTSVVECGTALNHRTLGVSHIRLDSLTGRTSRCCTSRTHVGSAVTHIRSRELVSVLTGGTVIRLPHINGNEFSIRFFNGNS